MDDKKYTIEVSHTRKPTREVVGTLDELNEYFGLSAKTARSLVSQVQKMYEKREAACFERTFVELKGKK